MHNRPAPKDYEDLTRFMCLLIFAHRAHPRYPLLVAANRDEFHRRATAPSGFWSAHPELLAGQDLEQGGTWMGITRGGRFAAVTNYRDPARTLPAPRSRGELPLDFLAGNAAPLEYLRQVAGRGGDYAGFNLLIAQGEALWYLSNDTARGEGEPRRLEPGIYGLSNARLDTPWPKVRRGKEKLRALLATPELDHDSLADLVLDRSLADTSELHQQGMESGMEQALSAQFIVTPEYGTRSTTTLLVQSDRRIHWRELSFDPRGAQCDRKQEEFDLAGP